MTCRLRRLGNTARARRTRPLPRSLDNYWDDDDKLITVLVE